MANFPSDDAQQQKVNPDSVFFQLSPEETKVMKDCSRDSFYQRSLPLAISLGGTSYMCVRAGFLKPNVNFGPWPKVVLAGFVGFLIGKYSYQTICAERLMQLPNSRIGQLLRERQGKAKGEFFEGNVMSSKIIPANYGTDTPSFSTDYKSDIDIDIHKPANSFDTDYKPDYDGLSNKATETPLPNFNTPTTYDELRARNRQDYERSQPNKPIYRSPSQSNTQPIWDNQPYLSSEPLKNSPQPKESYNQYGDVFN